MDKSILAQCEKEQLHLSGMIQGHGALVVVDIDRKITHISDNFEELLSFSDSLEPGASLPDELAHYLPSWPEDGERFDSFYISKEKRSFDLVISRNGGSTFIECTPSVKSDAKQTIRNLKLPTSISNPHQLEEAKEQLVQWISSQLGHERVMYYQFLEDGDGHVTQEACNQEGIGSYLDLRYPASDIPQIARKLYVKNPWREIPDAQKTSIGLQGNGQEIDLTYSDLRSVSKVHVQYMENMGVRSSVSFSVVLGEELDALIACHSSYPMKLELETLNEVHKVIREFTLLLKEFRSRQRLQWIDEIDRKTIPVRDLLQQHGSMEKLWTDLALWLQDYFSADGIILCSDDWVLSKGKVFEPEALDAVDNWFKHHCETLVFHTDNVHATIESSLLTEIAGAAGFKFKRADFSEELRFYCCRIEHVQEVKWGGNPNKPTISGKGELKISPRLSFEKWVEKRLGYSLPWKPSMTLQLHKIRNLFEASNLTIGDGSD